MFIRSRGRRAVCWYVAIVTSAVLIVPSATAGEKAKAAAECVSVHGALLAKSAGGDWQAVKAGDAIPSGTTLLSLFDSTVRSGGVEMKLLADVGQRGPFPILETSATVRSTKGFDLDVTAERGLLILSNTKEKGAAKVRLKVRDHVVELTLKEPKTVIGIELYGRLAPGEAHPDDPKRDEPTLFVFAFVAHGEVFLKKGDKSLTLHAPPGPAVLTWDSIFKEVDVRRLDTVPENLKPLDAKEKKQLDTICKVAEAFAGKERGKALVEAAKSKDALERTAAVTAMGALDDLADVFGVLSKSPHADTRQHAILVLRHWLGREPGQSAKLYKAMTTERKLTDIQARSLLALINGFEAERRSEPATYELLIEYLKHSQPAVRELAHWHLVRLAPAGNDIAFDALGTAAELEASYAAWRKLIPPGKLPPEPKK